MWILKHEENAFRYERDGNRGVVIAPSDIEIQRAASVISNGVLDWGEIDESECFKIVEESEIQGADCFFVASFEKDGDFSVTCKTLVEASREADQQNREDARDATVELPDKEARGVVVDGEIILTVATICHPGQLIAVEHKGRTFKAVPLAVELVHNIAALGCPYFTENVEDSEIFEETIASITSLPIATEAVGRDDVVCCSVLDGDEWRDSKCGGSWWVVEGRLSLFGAARRVIREAPVIDENGFLLGLAPVPSGPFPSMAIPHLALPAWLVEKITSAQN